MKDKNYIFPAIITKLGDDDYNVEFPDLKNITTYGSTLEEAYIMAEDALKLEIFDLYTDKVEIPSSSNIANIKVDDKQVLILVKVSLKEILKEHDNKAVKKTLTIPAWLAKLAEEEKVNYSAILQEALKEKLNL